MCPHNCWGKYENVFNEFLKFEMIGRFGISLDHKDLEFRAFGQYL